jgi:hypothetical protein
MSDQMPYIQQLKGYDSGVAIAVDDNFSLGASLYDGTVTRVTFTPEGAAIGDAVNRRTFRVINKGQTGGGGAVIATLDLIAGVNLVAFDETAATLSGSVDVKAGDELAWTSIHNGAGLVDPGGTVLVEITRA